MSLPNIPKAKYVAILLSSSLLLSACSDSVFEKRAKETEEKNKIAEESKEPLVEEQQPYEVEISEDQQKALEDSEIKESALEAVESSNLPERKEIAALDIPDKKAFVDLEEFSQYVNASFYRYHTKEIDAETFYKKLSPHFSENFKSMLPEGETEQLITFEVLQKAFNKRLTSPIVDYKITNSEEQKRVDQANVYRKYIQSNGGNIYYETVFVLEEERWKLFDDSPAPPYITADELNKKFEETKGD